MSKLSNIITARKVAKHGHRKYTDVDMACIKHDAAIQNSQVKRGELKRANNQYVIECGCGAEGCFIHGSFKVK
jgi:hypothetical protein